LCVWQKDIGGYVCGECRGQSQSGKIPSGNKSCTSKEALQLEEQNLEINLHSVTSWATLDAETRTILIIKNKENKASLATHKK
jgi:hypothetical protein